jgi:hypothetical protein
MAHDCYLVFVEVEKQLSTNPAVQLNELVQRLGCSYPVIEKAVVRHAHVSFRNHRHGKVLEKVGYLAVDGHSFKNIALSLGYGRPENLSRALRNKPKSGKRGKQAG